MELIILHVILVRPTHIYLMVRSSPCNKFITVCRLTGILMADTKDAIQVRFRFHECLNVFFSDHRQHLFFLFHKFLSTKETFMS